MQTLKKSAFQTPLQDMVRGLWVMALNSYTLFVDGVISRSTSLPGTSEALCSPRPEAHTARAAVVRNNVFWSHFKHVEVTSNVLEDVAAPFINEHQRSITFGKPTQPSFSSRRISFSWQMVYIPLLLCHLDFPVLPEREKNLMVTISMQYYFTAIFCPCLKASISGSSSNLLTTQTPSPEKPQITSPSQDSII